MAASEADVAAKLIERLLADPAFRARFRRDPAGACREAGLEELAQEMSLGGGKAMHTLDMRESKSSLAGVMMAAAMEGVGIYELTENVLPHLEEVPGHIADVLSRVDLPAIPGLHHGGGAAAAAGVTDAPHAGGGADAADAANGGGSSVPTPPAAPAGEPAAAAQPPGASASAAADSASKPSASAGAPAKDATAADAPAKSGASADAPAKSGAKAAVPPEAAAQKPSAAKRAAKKIAESLSPRAAHKQAASDAAAALDNQTKGLPESSDLPTAPPESGGTPPPADAAAASAPPADAAAAPGGGAATLPDSAPARLQATDATAPPPPEAVHHAAAAAADAPHTAAAHHGIDPSQFGQGGTGGHPDPEALALLHNKNVILDAHGIADIQAGRIDPRVVGVLTKLSQEHKITVSSISSDHPRFTTGGSVSNHYLGRGVDIAAIDGHIVDAGNPVARELASELSSLEPEIRPNEIGSPWAISGPGYFTDAAHHNHLHIGFKQPISPDWRPPADVAAPGDATAAAGAGAAKAAVAAPEAATSAAAPPEAAAAPPPPPAATTPAAGAAPVAPAGPPPSAAKGSLAFLQALDPKSRGPAHGQSQAFLKAVHPQQAAAQAPAGGAPAADGATAGAPGATAEAAASSFTDTAYPGDDASQAQIAAWMAAEAQKRGLPPQLPVMASLVESGVKNLNFGDRDSVGFFQMRVGTWNSGAYAGFPDKPELQIKWFLDQAEAVKAQRIARGQSVTDPHQFGDWIADIERPAEQYRGRYQLRLDEANGLLAQHAAAPPAAAAGMAPTPGAAGVAPAPTGAAADVAGAVTPPAPTGGGLGAAALKVAETQKGVREIGSSNTGPQVDHYLQAAGVPPGNPWCASFVTWSLQQAGHKMPGGGWAAVSTWVRNAEAGTNGLKIVSADQAQPGDIVAYDWGGGTDFSGDGHIGFLASNVNNGQFNALEGNNADAVNLVPRHLGGGPNIVFIHVEGNAPTDTPAAAAPAAPAATTPAIAGTPAPPAPEPVKHDSMMFQALVKQDQTKGRRASAMFLKAIDPSQQVKPATEAAAPPAPPAPAPPAPPEVAPPATPPAEAAAPPSTAAPAPDVHAAAAAPDAHAAAAAIDFTNAASHYPGDDASQAELARWLAGQAQKAGLPPELPVMASLVESGVRNLNYGDRDSVGFFQMRVGIWNQGAYAGFPDHPELQAKWFIDNALAVKRRAIAAGDANFGKDPSKFGEWIADIERPAEQYRGRYQLRLDEARKLLGG